jgi:purine operon repressor
MKGQRTERLVRIASRFMLGPSRHLSLTDLAQDFEVSKTVISDDMEIIDKAFSDEMLGGIEVDRGRSGGAYFVPRVGEDLRRRWLEQIAQVLSSPERSLPGGFVYYTDLIFDPRVASMLGLIMASRFSSLRPDTIMTSEVKGIPIAMFAAHALGVPLSICRFRNRPSDGPAVAVHFPTGAGDVRTMYMGTRQMGSSKRVLVVDDFMRGGSTVSGMLQMAKEFGSQVVGVGIFIAAQDPPKKSIPEYNALLTISGIGDSLKIRVND